jgi:hypothetical protein
MIGRQQVDHDFSRKPCVRGTLRFARRRLRAVIQAGGRKSTAPSSICAGFGGVWRALGAGGFHRRQSVAEHGGENGDHLVIAVVQFRRTYAAPAPAPPVAPSSWTAGPLRRVPGLWA